MRVKRTVYGPVLRNSKSQRSIIKEEVLSSDAVELDVNIADILHALAERPDKFVVDHVVFESEDGSAGKVVFERYRDTTDEMAETIESWADQLKEMAAERDPDSIKEWFASLKPILGDDPEE